MTNNNNEVRLTSKEVIERVLVDEMAKGTQVAVILGKEELDMIIVSLKITEFPSRLHNQKDNLIHGLKQLKDLCF